MRNEGHRVRSSKDLVPTRNLQAFQERSVESLGQWFLQGFHTGKFDGLAITVAEFKYMDPTSVIQDRFNHTSPFAQDKIRQAAGYAVRLWSKEKHGVEVLRNLAINSAYISSQDSIDPLARIVDENQVVRGKTPEEDHAWSTVMAVMSGFAQKHPEKTMPYLERWFFDDQFDWKAKGLLMNGMVGVKPDNYPEYLEQFLKIYRAHPKGFVIPIVLTAMTEIVGLPKLAQHLHELNDTNAIFLLKTLIQRTNSPFSCNPDTLEISCADDEDKNVMEVAASTVEDEIQRARLKKIFTLAQEPEVIGL